MQVSFEEIDSAQPVIKQKTACLHSFALHGIQARPIEIEVDIQSGLPSFTIVGLPDTAVSEAKDRVRSAIRNAGYRFPDQRVTVNLAPAHIKKTGSLYDLPIALGILIASEQMSPVPKGLRIIGECALDGRIRPIRGALCFAMQALQSGESLILPAANAQEVALLESGRLYIAATLSEIANQSSLLLPVPISGGVEQVESVPLVDMADIIGRSTEKRAIEIAAAGKHNVYMIGPPGIGKTLLAQALAGILPLLSRSEQLEVTMVQSLIGNTEGNSEEATSTKQYRPFMAPHHTASTATILGGAKLQPGALSMAHHGVLFLDELPEFRRDVLQALREPMESGMVEIRKAAGIVTYPAQTQVVAAQNPCPCGYYGIANVEALAAGKQCTCTRVQIDRYAKKVSGPLLDRFDIKLQMDYESASISESAEKSTQETSAQIRKRIMDAIAHKEAHPQLRCASEVDTFLEDAVAQHRLSLRGYTKTMQIATTIAHLDASPSIQLNHAVEALTLSCL